MLAFQYRSCQNFRCLSEVWRYLTSCVGLFIKGSVVDGVSDECDTTPCAPKVAPSLWTFQTTETSCGSECSRDHDVCLTAHCLPARCCAPGRHSRQRTAQTGRRSDSSKLRQGRQILGTNLESWRTTDASTQECSNNATTCTSWFSLAAHPRRRAHRSAAPSCRKPTGVPSGQQLGAGWVSSRFFTLRERVRVCSGEVGGAKGAVGQAVFVKAASFCRATRTGVQMPRKRRRNWTAASGRELGVPRCDVPWVQEGDNDEICCRRGVVSPAFSGAGTPHLHPSPVSVPAKMITYRFFFSGGLFLPIR